MKSYYTIHFSLFILIPSRFRFSYFTDKLAYEWSEPCTRSLRGWDQKLNLKSFHELFMALNVHVEKMILMKDIWNLYPHIHNSPQSHNFNRFMYDNILLCEEFQIILTSLLMLVLPCLKLSRRVREDEKNWDWVSVQHFSPCKTRWCVVYVQLLGGKPATFRRDERWFNRFRKVFDAESWI